MSKGPIRILHVVNAMAPAGLETWLMHILRRIDRERFLMDFMVQTTDKFGYDDEIHDLGSRVIPCAHRQRLITHTRDFRRILHHQGPYDVVHTHFHHYNGYALHLACQASVPVRVAHSHSDTSGVDKEAGFLRHMFIKSMKRYLTKNATVGLAVSREAAGALFGPDWEADPRWRILHPGIVPERFQATANAVGSARNELGIPADAFVIGHVGRFVEPKNHEFLVDVVSEVVKREPKARLLLIGDGPLRPDIERRVATAGIADKVILTGLRSDPERLMMDAMDVFVLPSLYEGLPLVGIEAQAAGVPLVLSSTISKDMDVVHPLIQRLSLSQPASAWAKVILAIRATAAPTNRSEALRLMRESHFNIDYSLKQLEVLYAE